jgi:hypothetical protein
VKLEDGKNVYTKAPTSEEEIYFLVENMKVNRHPPRSSLEVAFKPGTPVSDRLRKLQYDFGRQKQPKRESREQDEIGLKDQLAEARRQGQELEAVPTVEPGSNWTSGSFIMLALSLAGMVLGCSLYLRQRLMKSRG